MFIEYVFFNTFKSRKRLIFNSRFSAAKGNLVIHANRRPNFLLYEGSIKSLLFLNQVFLKINIITFKNLSRTRTKPFVSTRFKKM